MKLNYYDEPKFYKADLAIDLRCLRCRQETAPGSAAWLGTSTTIQRAIRSEFKHALTSKIATIKALIWNVNLK